MSDEANKGGGWVIYPIGSRPKWGLAFLLGAQQFLTQFGSTVIIPIIVGGAMGLPTEELALLISTMFFCAGITTLIQQSPIGNKLPILQGGTFSFLGPMFAIVGMCAAEGLGYEVMIQQVCAAVTTPPSVFIPQRESYNPGGQEWGPGDEPSDFEIWTYAYDVSGLTDVVLKYRIDDDGFNPLDSIQNETYAGGSEVGNWVSVPMSSS